MKQKKVKKINRESFDIGFLLGTRKTLEFLAEEDMLEPGEIAWLFEEKHFKKIKDKYYKK